MNELSTAQKEYFKDSQIKDNTGNLIPVYHGTDAEFNEFSKDFCGDSYGASYGNGFYFSDTPIPEYTGNVCITAYLDIKNPYIINDANSKEEGIKFMAVMGVSEEEAKNWIHYYDDRIKPAIGKALRENNQENLLPLKKLGYDGIVIHNTIAGVKNKITCTEVIAFEPEQIKSVDNLYPTKSTNFKDNSKDYLKEHLKDMSIDECIKLTKHIKKQESQHKTVGKTKNINRE